MVFGGGGSPRPPKKPDPAPRIGQVASDEEVKERLRKARRTGNTLFSRGMLFEPTTLNTKLGGGV